MAGYSEVRQQDSSFTVFGLGEQDVGQYLEQRLTPVHRDESAAPRAGDSRKHEGHRPALPHDLGAEALDVDQERVVSLDAAERGETGVYYDERGQPMLGSTLVRDLKFQDRVVAETRALLSEAPASVARAV